MEVKSVNLSSPRIVHWKGKEVETGIYKYPVQESIQLGTFGVAKDHVADLKVHGGIDKSCYFYSADHYEYWKSLYPDLDWNWGMLGENITVEGLEESKIHIGDVYEIGEAHIQISQPRQPCFKLGIKFGTQKILRDFINKGWPGCYARVIKEGKVEVGDKMSLIIRSKSSQSVQDIFKMLYSDDFERIKIENAVHDGNLAQSVRQQLLPKLERSAR